MSAVVEKRPPPSVARGSFDDRADERAAGHSLAARINHSLKERARRVWGRGGHCGGARGHSCPPAIVQRGLKDGALKRERRSWWRGRKGWMGCVMVSSWGSRRLLTRRHRQCWLSGEPSMGSCFNCGLFVPKRLLRLLSAAIA